MSRLSTKQRRAARRRRECYACRYWKGDWQAFLAPGPGSYEKWPGAEAFFDRIEERYSAMLRAAVKASTAMYGD